MLLLIGWGLQQRGKLSLATTRQVSDLTFAVLVPALLFRSMAKIDFTVLNWAVPGAYFGAAVPIFAGLAIWRLKAGGDSASAAVYALGGTFSNTFMLGIPLVGLAWGEPGLVVLLMVVALHSLVLQTSAIVLIEFGRGAGVSGSNRPSAFAALLESLKSTMLNPVITPIVLGLAWSFSGWPLPRAVDSSLLLAGAAAPPLCLILLGASLGQFGLRAGLRGATVLVSLKNFLHPLLVYLLASFVLNLEPLAVAVITLASALPVGNNVYLLAQRYDSQVPVASAAILLSTLVCALTLPVLLWLLQ